MSTAIFLGYYHVLMRTGVIPSEDDIKTSKKGILLVRESNGCVEIKINDPKEEDTDFNGELAISRSDTQIEICLQADESGEVILKQTRQGNAYGDAVFRLDKKEMKDFRKEIDRLEVKKAIKEVITVKSK